jgi:pSer/pThr/pTyr-binding forkhead associated (FHA) protein
MDVRFVIVSPATRKAEHVVKLPVVVGRGDEAKFRVQQDSVSRRHCELFIKDDTVCVRDLGSTNGTILDGERIASSVATVVPPGAQIRVGGILFRVEYQSAAVATPAESHEDDTVPMAAVEPAADEEVAAAEPASGGDDTLDDFFKSLT